MSWMKFLCVPMIAMVSLYLLSHTVESIVLESSPAVGVGKMSETSLISSYSTSSFVLYSYKTQYLWRIKNHIRGEPEVWRISARGRLLKPGQRSHIACSRRSNRTWIKTLTAQLTCLRGNVTWDTQDLLGEWKSHWGVINIVGTAPSSFTLLHFSLGIIGLLILFNNSAQSKSTLQQWPKDLKL